jgi:hypothetical protein
MNRWVCLHGRTDQPGYRFVCSTHWTRFGAQRFAAALANYSGIAGFTHQTYWVERRRPGDVPGQYTLGEH